MFVLGKRLTWRRLGIYMIRLAAIMIFVALIFAYLESDQEQFKHNIKPTGTSSGKEVMYAKPPAKAGGF